MFDDRAPDDVDSPLDVVPAIIVIVLVLGLFWWLA